MFGLRVEEQWQPPKGCCFVVVLLLLFCGLTSQSTTMVMLRWSVNLTTLFLGRLRPKPFTSYFVHILSPATDNCPTWISSRKRMIYVHKRMFCQTWGSNLRPSVHQVEAHLTKLPSLAPSKGKPTNHFDFEVLINRPWAGYRPPPPRGNFVHYDFLKLQYISHRMRHVSHLKSCSITV